MFRTGLRRAAFSARSQRSILAAPKAFRAHAVAVRMSSTSSPAFSLPADSYQLLSEAEKVGSSEDALYDQQIRDVESWWASDRYKGIKRPYTAHDIVSKRGSFQTQYPSSLMARKLFNLLEEKAAKGEPLHTSKSPDPGAKLNTRVCVVVATLFLL